VRSRWSPIAEGFPARKLALYVLAQLMGAICAAFVAIGLLLHLPTVGATVMTDTEIDTEIGFPFPAAGAGKAFLAEVIGTTAVVYVMLNVATVRHLARNSYFGNQPGLLCD
jgi:glycerol uptake facilitator-like aquaporin